MSVFKKAKRIGKERQEQYDEFQKQYDKIKLNPMDFPMEERADVVRRNRKFKKSLRDSAKREGKGDFTKRTPVIIEAIIEKGKEIVDDFKNPKEFEMDVTKPNKQYMARGGEVSKRKKKKSIDGIAIKGHTRAKRRR